MLVTGKRVFNYMYWTNRKILYNCDLIMLIHYYALTM